MSFITENFLLHNDTARRLYFDYAAPQPVLDYHNHLPVKDIAENRTFANLYDIWLAGDHYKWRAMRTAGVPEELCTGDADPRDKFLAWARTVPQTLRNPLFHWTHLELQRYFGIDTLLNAETAPAIWDEANAKLQTPELSAHGILRKFYIAALCTTDDPTDSLEYHETIDGTHSLATKVYPAFRPDKALAVHQPEQFNAWLTRLESASNTHVNSLPSLLKALELRHSAFHDVGCRLSDHGMTSAPSQFADHAEAASIFDRARIGQAATPDEQDRFAGYLMLFFGRLDAQRGWTKQLHLGALRNTRTLGLHRLGPDTGYDSIGDAPQAAALAAYMDRLDQDGALPKMVLYNVNPSDNYVFSTMAANFQDGKTPGKIQFGSGWWFLDAKDGIEWQLNALSNNGLLARFVGMLTDSRSFMSYPRHEYFRRVLCNLLGAEIERGELPDDDALIGGMVQDICFNNIKIYLNLPGV